MNAKKIIFAIAATFALLTASCSPNTTSEDESLYVNGVDKTKLPSTADKSSVDKTKLPSTANRGK